MNCKRVIADKPCVFFVALLLFWGLTFIYVNYYKPYEIAGTEMLKNTAFENNFEGWLLSGHDIERDFPGSISLYSMEMGESVFIYQIVSEFAGVKFLRLSGMAETGSVAKGPDGWERGRLFANYYDENGKKLFNNVVALPWGDSDWAYYEGVFELKPGTETIRVGANIAMVSGVVRVQDISLVPVVIKDETAYLRALGVAVWAVMIVWLMWGYLKRMGRQHMTILIIIVLLVAGMAMPGGVKDWLAGQLPDISFRVSHTFTIDIEAVSHFSLFLVAAFFLIKEFADIRLWVIIADLVLLSIFTEMLQVFIGSRSAEIVDLALNCLGIAIGAGLAILWRKRAY